MTSPYLDDGAVQVWHGDCREVLTRPIQPTLDLGQ